MKKEKEIPCPNIGKAMFAKNFRCPLCNSILNRRANCDYHPDTGVIKRKE